MKKWILFGVIFSSGFFVDQITKYWALQNLKECSIPVWKGVLDLHLRNNPGSAFGFVLLSRWGIMALTVGLSVAFGVWMVKAKENFIWQLLGGSLFLAGAWGNLLDRLRWGHVIDFLKPSFWATFNLGDVLILGGVLCFSWRFFFSKDR
ncbi:MAG: signal peptidase II [Candidatus Caldatribacteriaceae bacterium]